MKIAIALLAVTFGAATVPLQSADASDKGQPLSQGATSKSEDFSAKKRKRHRVYVYPEHYAYHHAYPRAFSPGDPSYQSPELIRLRALNRCVFDLGYGRWQNCN